MNWAFSLSSEFGGAQEIIRTFHQIWYGVDAEPVVTLDWVRAISAYRRAQQKPEVGEKGFKAPPGTITKDGRIIRMELVHDTSDTLIYNIVNRLFGYEK